MTERNSQVDAELADMAMALAHNPETRKDLARIVKKAGLKYKFNDVDAEAAAVIAAQAAATATIEEDRAARQQQQVQDRLNAQRQKLIDDGRYDEATIKDKLEPFMTERGIASYTDAVILYAHEHPPENPRPEIAHQRMWELPTNEWQKDSAGAARITAHKAIHDIIQARR